MLLGPYLTELLAEQFTTGHRPQHLDAFDPDRFEAAAVAEDEPADYYARYARR
jgi:hypothetical protein